MTPDLQRGITDGAYWLRKPGENCEAVIAYTGAVAPEAIEATGLHRRKPPGCRPAGDHLGGPAACRLDRGAKTAARPPRAPSISAISKIAGAAAARLRHRHRDRRPSRRRWAGSAACAATASRRSASSISARPAPSTTSIATTASTPTPSSMRKQPPARPAPAKWRCDVTDLTRGTSPPATPGGTAQRCAVQLLFPSQRIPILICRGWGRGWPRQSRDAVLLPPHP